MKIYHIFILVLINIAISCTSESNNRQIQTLIENNLYHTHDIKITLEDIKNNSEEYYTTENLNHKHKIILNLEDRQKLLNGLKITKETEEANGHKHTLEIRLFSF